MGHNFTIILSLKFIIKIYLCDKGVSMEMRTRLLDIKQLQDGMITAKEIIYNGTVLIGKDIKLTNNLLDKLNLIYYLDKVEVYISEEE